MAADKWFQCSYCHVEFHTTDSPPMCPRGCQKPRELSEPMLGLSTAKRIPGPTPQPAPAPRKGRRTVTEDEKAQRFRDFGLRPPKKKPKAEAEPEKEEPAQPQVNEEDLTGKGPCPYCGKEWKQRQLHIPRCPQGPKVPVAKKEAVAS